MVACQAFRGTILSRHLAATLITQLFLLRFRLVKHCLHSQLARQRRLLLRGISKPLLDIAVAALTGLQDYSGIASTTKLQSPSVESDAMHTKSAEHLTSMLRQTRVPRVSAACLRLGTPEMEGEVDGAISNKTRRCCREPGALYLHISDFTSAQVACRLHL